MTHPVTILSFFPESIQSMYGHVILLCIVVLIALVVGMFARKMTAEVPSKPQVIFEGIIGGLTALGDDVMGKAGRIYMPLIFGIGFYVAVSNLMGIVPGLLPPTMNMNTTLAPALCVFIFYQYLGIRKHGFGYIKHFLGPVPLLAPLMLVIELVGHLARPLSLTMRLFGNVSGEEMVVTILFALVPFMVPLPMYFLLGFTGLLQAFVFMILSMVYIGGALEEAH